MMLPSGDKTKLGYYTYLTVTFIDLTLILTSDYCSVPSVIYIKKGGILPEQMPAKGNIYSQFFCYILFCVLPSL